MKKIFVLLVLFVLFANNIYAYDFAVDGYRYNVLTSNTASFMGPDSDNDGEIVIPEYVTYAGKQLSVTTIGTAAFSSYKSSFLRIPQYITYIEDGAFRKAEIDSVHFDDSDTPINLQNTINKTPSMSSAKFVSIYIGRTIYTTDGNSNAYGAFYSSKIKNIYIGGKCEELASEIFSLTTLESFRISDDAILQTIGGEAFSQCSYLKTVDLKEGLKAIQSKTFYNCTSLDSVYIPSTVKYISADAFSQAKNIKTIVATSISPIVIDDNTFPGLVYLSATLYVPKGTKSIYEAADGWKEFLNIVEMTPTPTSIDNISETIPYNVIKKVINKGNCIIEKNGKQYGLNGIQLTK